MITFAAGIILGLIVAAFVWLHLHHTAQLKSVESALWDEVQTIWRDAKNAEDRLMAKIEGHDAS